MRRPSALPPSGRPDDVSPDDVPPHEDPSYEAASYEASSDGEAIEDLDHATEPVEPLAVVTPLSSSDAVSHGTAGSGGVLSGLAKESDAAQSGLEPEETGTIPPQRPVRWRDVWRAARARRRVLRAEMRRFTVRARRRRTIWLVSVGALVALIVGSVGAAYSPLFAVHRVLVVGAAQPGAAEIEAALAAQVGTPLPLVDASEVKAALVAFPQVESYTLEARPPHELVVRIVERTPIGVVESDAGWSVVDAAGVIMSTTPDAPEGVPVITVEGGLSSGAFTSLGQVMRALPDDVLGQVVGASATSRDDVTLQLASGSQVVWGSVDASPEKVVVLEALMSVHPPGSVGVYDVTSPKAAVVR